MKRYGVTGSHLIDNACGYTSSTAKAVPLPLEGKAVNKKKPLRMKWLYIYNRDAGGVVPYNGDLITCFLLPALRGRCKRPYGRG